MIGLLFSRGLRVQQSRIREVVRRVDPAGTLFRTLSLRTVNWRSYNVSSPLALWHVDGNHKLIRALENTLHLMNGRNENYRKSFNKVEQTSEEFEERENLEEQLRAVMDKYKYKRRQIRELQEDLETMNNSLSTLAKDEQDLVELLNERQSKRAHLEKELIDQKTKHERTKKHNTRMARNIRSAKNTKGETHEERDIELREIRDFNTEIMKQIGGVIQSDGDMAVVTQLYFNQAGLPSPPSPSRLGSRPTSGLSSRSSSLSSNRSVSSVRSVDSHRSIGSVNISLEVGDKTAVASSRSSVGSPSTKTKPSSQPGSRPASQPGSRPASQSGSRPASQPARPASQSSYQTKGRKSRP